MDKLVTEYGGGVLHAAVRPHTPSFVREPSVAAARSASGVARSRGTCAQSDRALPDERARSKSRRRLGILRVHHRRRGVGSPDAGRRRRLLAHPVLREKPVATVLMRHGNPRMRNNYGGHVLRRCSSPGPGSGLTRTRRGAGGDTDRVVRSLLGADDSPGRGQASGGASGTLLVDKERPALGEAVIVSGANPE